MKRIEKQFLHKKADELSGLSDINMHKEAVELAKQLLAEEQLDAMAFNDALSAILISNDNPEDLRELVQAAYSRLTKTDQQKACHQMLGYRAKPK
jgi:hypothetical protein